MPLDEVELSWLVHAVAPDPSTRMQKNEAVKR
jgi:hypothetical protein